MSGVPTPSEPLVAAPAADDADAPAAAGGRPPAVEKLTASQQARRHRIVRAAMSLLEERSYEKIQMRDVAEAAGVALGTLYRYFPSKEQLFAAVMLDWAGSYEARMRRTAATGATDAQRLTAALVRAVEAFERRPQFLRVQNILEVATDPDVVELYRQFATRTQAALADTLHDLSEDDVVAVVALAAALLGSLLRGWALGRHTIEDVYAKLERSIDLVFSGPGTRSRSENS